MTDGMGSMSYQYDQRSRLTSETRQFTDPVTPFLNGSFTLSYSYNLAGEVAAVTDPTGVAVNYGYDKTGRLSGVTGTTFAGVSQYATGMQYRAFGALSPDLWEQHGTHSDLQCETTAGDSAGRPRFVCRLSIS